MLFRKKTKIQYEETSVKTIKTREKLGLALSGGGGRGFGHIGAIKAFEEAGFKFDFVAGTSAGSIVGAMYSAGVSVTQMEKFGDGLTVKDVRNHTLFFRSSDSSNIERLCNKLLDGLEFSDLKIPFSAVAVDIVTGDEEILNNGNVSKAVSASCAAPIFFTPVRIGHKLLVDGGLLNNIPADVVRKMGADYVISVDLNSGRGSGTNSTDIVSMAFATWRITTKNSAYKGIQNSDFIIPPDLSRYSSTNLEGYKEMIEIGYRTTKERIPEILRELRVK